MLKIERAVIENGSSTEMRSLAKLSSTRGGGAAETAKVIVGFWLAGLHGYIRAYPEGNYTLTDKGASRLQSLSGGAGAVQATR